MNHNLPSLLGSGLCLLTALICFKAALIGEDRASWGMIALLMLGLGIDRQVGAVTTITELLRGLSMQQGWYGQRAGVQRDYIETVLDIAVIGTPVFLVRFHRRDPALLLAVLAALGLVAFVLVRASSKHTVDALLARHYAGFTINAWLENPPVLTIALLAWISIVRRDCAVARNA